MGSNRLPYFPFYADDYLNDHAVMGMDADAEGCYIRLLARSWCNTTPGVIPAKLVPEMAGLHRITDELAPEMHIEACAGWDGNGYRRRLQIMEQMAECFDLASRPGFWIQRRMVREHQKLTSSLEARRRGAQTTNSQRPLTVTVNERSPARIPTEEVEVDLEVEEEKKESTHLSTDVDVAVVRSLQKTPRSQKRKTPEEVEWERTFHDWFWGAYWRKASKSAALKAWMGISPKTQDMVESINEGLVRHRSVVLAREKDKQPHAATWLNQRRWEDQDA
jgi:uncharacterized protein YdaU (DUF1376 family)